MDSLLLVLAAVFAVITIVILIAGALLFGIAVAGLIVEILDEED